MLRTDASQFLSRGKVWLGLIGWTDGLEVSRIVIEKIKMNAGIDTAWIQNQFSLDSISLETVLLFEFLNCSTRMCVTSQLILSMTCVNIL